ncbi:hypothetical protein L9F63_005565, partial [Diploptera punctata]
SDDTSLKNKLRSALKSCLFQPLYKLLKFVRNLLNHSKAVKAVVRNFMSFSACHKTDPIALLPFRRKP